MQQSWSGYLRDHTQRIGDELDESYRDSDGTSSRVGQEGSNADSDFLKAEKMQKRRELAVAVQEKKEELSRLEYDRHMLRDRIVAARDEYRAVMETAASAKDRSIAEKGNAKISALTKKIEELLVGAAMEVKYRSTLTLLQRRAEHNRNEMENMVQKKEREIRDHRDDIQTLKTNAPNLANVKEENSISLRKAVQSLIDTRMSNKRKLDERKNRLETLKEEVKREKMMQEYKNRELRKKVGKKMVERIVAAEERRTHVSPGKQLLEALQERCGEVDLSKVEHVLKNRGALSAELKQSQKNVEVKHAEVAAVLQSHQDRLSDIVQNGYDKSSGRRAEFLKIDELTDNLHLKEIEENRVFKKLQKQGELLVKVRVWLEDVLGRLDKAGADVTAREVPEDAIVDAFKVLSRLTTIMFDTVVGTIPPGQIQSRPSTSGGSGSAAKEGPFQSAFNKLRGALAFAKGGKGAASAASSAANLAAGLPVLTSSASGGGGEEGGAKKSVTLAGLSTTPPPTAGVQARRESVTPLGGGGLDEPLNVNVEKLDYELAKVVVRSPVKSGADDPLYNVRIKFREGEGGEADGITPDELSSSSHLVDAVARELEEELHVNEEESFFALRDEFKPFEECASREAIKATSEELAKKGKAMVSKSGKEKERMLSSATGGLQPLWNPRSSAASVVEKDPILKSKKKRYTMEGLIAKSGANEEVAVEFSPNSATPSPPRSGSKKALKK